MAALLPTMVTVALILWVVWKIHINIGAHINEALGVDEWWRIFVGDAIALLVFVALMWVTGFFLATYLGRWIYWIFDRIFRRVPLVRVVYPAVKQVTDFFLSDNPIPYSRVVAVPYPRKGIYALGFLTSEGMKRLESVGGEQMVSIFIPSTPTPLTGFTIFVKRSELVSLDVTVDEAVKTLISGGVVVPENERYPGSPVLTVTEAPDPGGFEATDAGEDGYDLDEPSEDDGEKGHDDEEDDE
jgi:uncharacterized membrane protein